jgi:hypothetical protein
MRSSGNSVTAQIRQTRPKWPRNALEANLTHQIAPSGFAAAFSNHSAFGAAHSSIDESRAACTHARMSSAKRYLPREVSSCHPSARAEDKEPLQVRLPVHLKRQFKSHAALRGMEPHQLFVEVWEHYEASLRPSVAEDEET